MYVPHESSPAQPASKPTQQIILTKISLYNFHNKFLPYRYQFQWGIGPAAVVIQFFEIHLPPITSCGGHFYSWQNGVRLPMV